MIIHRLMKKEHSESLLMGGFRFGRLRYYQMLEVVYEDNSIGDSLEGTRLAVVSANITPDRPDDHVRTNLARGGFINIQGEVSVEIQNSTFRNEIDCFVSCWSTSAEPDLSGTGSEYDTCVTANGAKFMAYLLRNFGVERESGSKLQTLFEPTIESRRVRYDHTEHDMAVGQLPNGDPFLKRIRYRHQSEYRLVLVPLQPISADFIVIECPQAANLLKSTPIVRSQAVIPSTRNASRDAEDSKELLELILSEWRRQQHVLEIADRQEFDARRRSGHGGIDAKAWREDMERSRCRRNEALAEFDRIHLKDLRRCLFELRRPPFNEGLDRTLAHGLSSHCLIEHYELQNLGLSEFFV